MARALTASGQIFGGSIRPLLVLLWGLYLCAVTLAVGHWVLQRGVAFSQQGFPSLLTGLWPVGAVLIARSFLWPDTSTGALFLVNLRGSLGR